jgi:hypothetical protein
VFASSEKEKFEEKKENPFILSSGKKPQKKIGRILPQSECQDQKEDKHISDRITRKVDLSDNSPPIRKKKVKEAKKKKRKGDYDSQEVYKKIADRLMDLFGV